jgi:hypothetical protein
MESHFKRAVHRITVALFERLGRAPAQPKDETTAGLLPFLVPWPPQMEDLLISGIQGWGKETKGKRDFVRDVKLEEWQ